MLAVESWPNPDVMTYFISYRRVTAPINIYKRSTNVLNKEKSVIEINSPVALSKANKIMPKTAWTSH